MKQREIKFRIYDKVRKEWVHGPGHEINLLGECIVCGEILRRPDDTTVSLDSLDDLAILQFTGLLDRNGKEIYEGDIVQRGVIVFNNAKFQGQYYGSGGLYEMWEDDLCSESGMVVLGNIYENPDLLQ